MRSSTSVECKRIQTYFLYSLQGNYTAELRKLKLIVHNGTTSKWPQNFTIVNKKRKTKNIELKISPMKDVLTLCRLKKSISEWSVVEKMLNAAHRTIFNSKYFFWRKTPFHGAFEWYWPYQAMCPMSFISVRNNQSINSNTANYYKFYSTWICRVYVLHVIRVLI